jgi:hypothetical protein
MASADLRVFYRSPIPWGKLNITDEGGARVSWSWIPLEAADEHGWNMTNGHVEQSGKNYLLIRALKMAVPWATLVNFNLYSAVPHVRYSLIIKRKFGAAATWREVFFSCQLDN